MNTKKLKRRISELISEFEEENETTILDITIYSETEQSKLGKEKVVARRITFLCE